MADSTAKNYTKHIYSPCTGEKIADAVYQTKVEILTAINRARFAQPSWAETPLKDRCRAMGLVRDFIVKHADEAAERISRCTGKPLVDSLSAEVLPAAMLSNFYPRLARKVLKPLKTTTSSPMVFNKRSIVYHEPLGVVAIISPWNYPLGIPFHEVITGLLSGNSVLLKVATQAQDVGRFIKAAVDAGNIPSDVFTLIEASGSTAGKAFTEGDVNKIFFTGSTEVGRQLAEQAGKHLIPVSLELGGNDPLIILNDADPYRSALGTVWAGLSNTGQSCGGAERILVQVDIYDRYTRALYQIISSLRQGHYEDFTNELGALTTRSQHKIVISHVEDALSKGARISVRSATPPEMGSYHEACVLEDVTQTMKAVEEETFGPVLTLQQFRNVDDAIAMANASRYGLSASVWTRNIRLAKFVAKRLDCGSVAINDHLVQHAFADIPWGGVKESGFGRSHGRDGFYEMTRTKAVVNDVLHKIPSNLWWAPYNKNTYDTMNAALRFFYGRAWKYKVRDLLKLISGYIRTFFRSYKIDGNH